MRKRKFIPKGLYGITGEKFSKGRTNYECVKAMIDGGIKIIQYREKEKSTKEQIEEIKEIAKLCKEKGVLFIINDHVDIALLVDVDGVHVGQDDMCPSDIRKILGDDKIIGVSTHSKEQADIAFADMNIDYIGVGPIFPTTTKDTAPVGLEYLDYVVNNIDMPFVAIGGIKAHNIEQIISKDAHCICMVSEVVGADNIRNFVKKYQDRF